MCTQLKTVTQIFA